MKCDCGKNIPLPSDKRTVGLSCSCGIYWDIAHSPNTLIGRPVRWNCEVCGSSRQICKNAPPISKCYRGPDMMTAHLSPSKESN